MDEDDEFGADAEFLGALATSEISNVPRRVQQPIPQRLDPARPSSNSSSTGPKIVQPTPQAIASRSAGSSILVSPRQKGNPILTNLRSFAWEYSDIPADYALGLTTCALFLSLKYHRLHPEYVYNRIKSLAGKYNVRVLLVMVDISNHEDSLKELSKTSLVNNVTIILCWSAAEAARYLELYKSYEHANASAIRGTESKGYAEKIVEFVTVPRSINKTDAVSLVSAFGSVRAAVNARPEEIAVVGGWGEKKVKRWCTVMDEPFRARKAAKRVMTRGESLQEDDGEEMDGVLSRAVPLSRVPSRNMTSALENPTANTPAAQQKKSLELVDQFQMWDPDEDDEEALIAAAAAAEEEEIMGREKNRDISRRDNELSGGVAAALAKLRDKN